MEKNTKKKKFKIKRSGYHKFVYFTCRPLLTGVIKACFHARVDKESLKKLKEIKGPMMVFMNHTMDLDFANVILACKKQIYFVYSEHLLRNGLPSKLFSFNFGGIPMYKGTVSATTVKEILQYIKAGKNVAMFPEGQRTYSGCTNEYNPAAIKLAKMSGANLVILRASGGYFTSPRWSIHSRKGKLVISVKSVYSAERLKSMNFEELQKLVTDDLYVDAYAEQSREPIEYICKKGYAERIEYAMYLCPNCLKFNTIKSCGDQFSCDCGFNGKIDSYGYLHGDLSFKTVAEWDVWQTNKFNEMYEKFNDDDVMFADEGVTLSEVYFNHDQKELLTGTVSSTKHSFSIGDYTFNYKDTMCKLIKHGQVMCFSNGESYYELKGDNFLARKYVFLSDKETQNSN